MTRPARIFVLASFLMSCAAGLRADDQNKNLLASIFTLQWQASHRGKPLELTGKAGAISFYASAPINYSSNPASAPGGSRSEIYFSPWVLGEWRDNLSDSLSCYASGQFTDYLYGHDHSLNYAYAEFSTGLNQTLVSSKSFSLDVYSSGSFDYNLTSNYSRDTLEWIVTTGVFGNAILGNGHSVYVNPLIEWDVWTPGFYGGNVVGAVTVGWNWDITKRWSAGAYCSSEVTSRPSGSNTPDWTQYAGLILQWKVIEGIELNANCVQTWNLSACRDSRYQEFEASLAARISSRVFDAFK